MKNQAYHKKNIYSLCFLCACFAVLAVGGCAAASSSSEKGTKQEVVKDLTQYPDPKNYDGKGVPVNEVRYPIETDESGNILNFPTQQDYETWKKEVKGKNLKPEKLDMSEGKPFELYNQFLGIVPDWPILINQADYSLEIPSNYELRQKSVLCIKDNLTEVSWEFKMGPGRWFSIPLNTKELNEAGSTAILGVYANKLAGKVVNVSLKGTDQKGNPQCSWSYVTVSLPEDSIYFGYTDLSEVQHPDLMVHMR